MQVLTSQSLATFTLSDCVVSLLDQTLEVLPAYQLARLQVGGAGRRGRGGARERGGGGEGGVHCTTGQWDCGAERSAATRTTMQNACRGCLGPHRSAGGWRLPAPRLPHRALPPLQACLAGAGAAPAAAGACKGFISEPATTTTTTTSTANPPEGGSAAMAAGLRLARYSLRRVGVVERLMDRLATVPETVEMSRATGLTIDQAGRGGGLGSWSCGALSNPRQGCAAICGV